MKRTTAFRILSLPDEILTVVFQCVSSRSDRRNIALTCSRFRHVMKQAQLSLDLHVRRSPLELVQRLARLSKAKYTCISSLAIFGKSNPQDLRSLTCSFTSEDTRLLSTVGSTCPDLESLRIFALDDLKESAWRKLGEGCRILSNLEICFVSPPVVYPPFDMFRSLKTLGLHLDKFDSHVPSLGLCSSLTSLTLWNCNGFHLSKLASSSPLPSLRSLTLYNSILTSSLSSFASFPNLSSISFHSCMGLDVDDMQALACFLHSLTHLTLDNCLLVSISGVAAVVESNPKLTSLSLQEGSHLLLSPPRFKALLACCRHLSTLSLSVGLVLHSSLLAECSSLQSLSINDGSGSLEGLAGMVLRVEKASTDGGNSMRQEKAGNGEGARQRGARCGKVVSKASIWGRRGHLVRVAAAAARQNTVSALKQWDGLHGHCLCETGSVRGELLSTIYGFEKRGPAVSIYEIQTAMTHFKLKISACGLLQQVHAEAEAALEDEEALKRLISAVGDLSAFILRPGEAAGAAESASVAVPAATAAATPGSTQGLAAEEGSGWPLVDESDTAAGSDPREQVRTMIVAMRAMCTQLEAVDQALRDPAPVLIPRPTSPELHFSGNLRMEAHGIRSAGEAVSVDFKGPLLRSLSLKGFQFNTSAEQPAWLQEAFNQQPNPSIPDASSSSALHATSVTALKPHISVRSTLYAAAFGGLQRLSLEGCSGLDEEDLAALLNACQGLLHLTMDVNDDFSDRVIDGVKLLFLSSLSMLSCEGVSAAGVDGLLRSFPRVARVKVDREKVTERTGRVLGRAGVIVVSD